MTNWIEDTNKYKLPAPPEWWLQRLADFDNSLVVVPSRQEFCYRLAQKRPLSLNEKMVHDMLKEQADSAMMASHGLVPVTTIMANPNWDNPLMWNELAERAPWRQGGAEKVQKIIDENEAHREAAIAAKNDELTTGLAKDSYKFYRKKIGLGRTWGDRKQTPRTS